MGFLRAKKLVAALIAVPTIGAGLTAVAGGAAAGAAHPPARPPRDRLKPALRGLVVTQPSALGTVPYADFGSMKLPWNTIETQPGVYNFSAIDTAMAQHPDVRFRLRFMAGIHAPQWVKDDSGGCVLIEPDSGNGGSGCAPRFWTDAFHADYVALMQAVAARYEADPQVVEIANSECTTIFAEPFILGANSASIDRLWQAGYTEAGPRHVPAPVDQRHDEPVPDHPGVPRRSQQVAVHRPGARRPRRRRLRGVLGGRARRCSTS